ncbi:hypothetical protein G9A89_023363 [Geosiphon pyriformis]|nr:hypothetical protein G9A89_023363 [Geosiphon pyriformis]
MEPVGFAAGGSGSISAELRTRSGVKNKRLVGPHSRSASYKKPKKSVAVDGKVDSISGVLDLNNMENVITEKTCYAESNVLGLDDNMDDAMPRKTCTRTYVLNSKLPPLSFNVPSDGEDTLPLPSPKFYGSIHLPPIGSRALEKWNFNSSKSFALDIELSAIPGKINGDKLVSIKKNFYHVDGFGGASTSSKFPEIIRSTFTSEASMNKAKSLAVSGKILVNNELRKINSRSNQEIVVKEISVNLPKSAVKSVFSKFGEIVSIRMQLVGLWQKILVEFKSAEIAGMVASKWSVFMGKDSVRVALATEDKQSWVSRNRHRALLYTLPVGTTAYDLSDLLESYNEKTCFIGRNSVSYVRNKCAIVCFNDKAAKLAAISTIPIFKSCKQFGYIHADCLVDGSSGAREKRVVSDQDRIHLAGIYKKKSASIAHPVLFGGKTWAQVASGTPFYVFLSSSSGYDLHSGLVHPLAISDPLVVSHLNDRLAILEHSLELLADCVSGILVRLDSFGVVPLVPSFMVSTSVVSAALNSEVDSDMIVNNALSSSGITLFVANDAVVNLSTSGSKVLTAKVDGLETKLVTLEASVGSVLDKLNLLCSGLGLSALISMNNCAKQADIVHWHKDMNNLVSIVTETKFDGIRIFTSDLDSDHMGSGVAIILNSLLARHVCKVSEVPGQLLSVRLLFRNKLSVSILGLYAGASLVVRFSQAGNINFFIAKVINKSSFIILGGDFNEDGSHKCASFNKCFDLGLVNSLGGSSFVKSPTWCNSHGVAKTIDYIFVSFNLINTVVNHSVAGIDDFFDTDYKAVSVSVGIDAFVMAKKFSDMDEIWNVVRKIMVLSTNGTFKKKWFKSFDSVFNKVLSKFHKLELLVSKLVRNSRLVSSEDFALLLETWNKLNSSGVSVVKSLFLSGSGFNPICSALAKARKLYCASKLLESKCAEESSIKQTISKRIESFELNKSHTIKSVLEHPFRKVVLDHLVVRDELVLEPDSVKSKVDKIMEGWTRKHRVVSDISGNWVRQYWSLEHVFDGAFSGVMCLISFDEMLAIVMDLLDGKVAGLSGISNEL